MADKDKSVSYEITGNAQGFVAAMMQAQKSAKEGNDQISSAFKQAGDAMEKVMAPLKALAAIVGGGAFFKAAIGETSKLTSETMSLARAMGINSEEASALNTALGDIGTDADTYTGAFQQFARQLKKNEEGVNQFGIATRDGNGHLRNTQELFQAALEKVKEYKPGIDQTTAAMTLFGKSVDDAMKLQRLNNKITDEAKEKNTALGLTITEENVEANKKYKAAMNDVGDVFSAISKQVGQAVMPVFTELADYFASAGPYVITVFKGALAGLLGVFRAIQSAVKVMANVVFEVFSTIIDMSGNVGRAFAALIAGNFSDALSEVKEFGSRFVQSGKNMWRAFLDEGDAAGNKFNEDLERIWGKGKAAPAPGNGTKKMGDFDKGDKTKTDKTAKDPSEQSFMKYYEGALAEERNFASQRDALHEYQKSEELAFWQHILKDAHTSSADRVAIEKKVADLQVDIRRTAAQNQQAIEAENERSYNALAMGRVAIAQAQAQAEFDMGNMTKAQLLEQQQEFEAQRYNIMSGALQARIDLLSQDPEMNVVEMQKVKSQLLEQEQQYQIEKINLSSKLNKEVESQGLFNNIGSSLGNGLNGMITQFKSFQQTLGGIFRSIYQSFIKAIVTDPFAAWIATQARMIAAKLGFAGQAATIDAAASATAVGTKATEATAVVGANAVEAASGAAASQASIPWVGPVLAMAAMAAMLAAVGGLKGGIKSASGGFDIPHGLNPVTQLHQDEMVLPAHLANAVRNMTGGEGNATSATQPINVHISAMDSRDVHRALMQGGALHKAITQLNRDFKR